MEENMIQLFMIYYHQIAMTWINICKLDVLDDEKLVAFDFNDKKILVTKIQDKIYATDRICTHEYADLSTGYLNEEEKNYNVFATFFKI
jgi:nitrite reductase/ring-hydroxylating ferredoxin subunit